MTPLFAPPTSPSWKDHMDVIVVIMAGISAIISFGVVFYLSSQAKFNTEIVAELAEVRKSSSKNLSDTKDKLEAKYDAAVIKLDSKINGVARSLANLKGSHNERVKNKKLYP